MAFIVQYWWLFLLATCLGWGLAFYTQWKWMQRLMEGRGEVIGDFGKMFIFAGLGTISCILFLLSLILNIIAFAKQ